MTFTRVHQRGMFTGNRGCLVDDQGEVVRHHRGALWIVCLTEFRDWRHPLAEAGRWTPLFFLDDAVALAAGHRPCGLCRREDYERYRRCAGAAGAAELNRRLAVERLGPGRGLSHAADRKVWQAEMDELPAGAVIADAAGHAHLVTVAHVQPFTFGGWGDATPRPQGAQVGVLTPPTSLAALRAGYRPVLHASAAD